MSQCLLFLVSFQLKMINSVTFGAYTKMHQNWCEKTLEFDTGSQTWAQIWCCSLNLFLINVKTILSYYNIMWLHVL